jgi:hypothetical protein
VININGDDLLRTPAGTLLDHEGTQWRGVIGRCSNAEDDLLQPPPTSRPISRFAPARATPLKQGRARTPAIGHQHAKFR